MLPIVFNWKALLVGIATVIVVVICAKLDWSAGPSFFLSGLAAMMMSFLLSRPYTGYLKLPLVFFIPTHLPAALLILIGLATWGKDDDTKTKSGTTGSSKTENVVSNTEEEERLDRAKILLRYDMSKLGKSKYTGDTAMIRVIERQMRADLMDAMQPDSMHYLLEYNLDTTRALFLMSTSFTDDLAEDIKQKEMFVVTTGIPALRGAKRYIGIVGPDGLYALKIPGQEFKEKSFLYGTDELAEFYSTDTIRRKP